MSVVEAECAERCSGVICEHAKKFYDNGIIGDPIMFYLIEPEEIPPPGQANQSRSSTGDDCHHDITGLSNERLKTAFKKKNPGSIQICDGDGSRPLNEADTAALSARLG